MHNFVKMKREWKIMRKFLVILFILLFLCNSAFSTDPALNLAKYRNYKVNIIPDIRDVGFRYVNVFYHGELTNGIKLTPG